MDELTEKLKKLLGESKEIEIENFDLEAGELELQFIPQPINAEGKKKLTRFDFLPSRDEYKSAIAEVRLGATKKEGGTRTISHRIGGQTAPPFYFFEGKFPNRPLISQDVFDMPISLPTHVRKYFHDVMEDPIEWAKFRVKEFNAQMITLHLVSSDPTVKDTPVKESCKLIEDFIQQVKVPVIIGGSGNPEKDPELLEKAAEICAGEKVLLSTVDPDMDYKRVAKAAVEHGHSVLSLVSMNPDEMRRLNKNLMKQGLKQEQIVMDLFTGGVGYGIEYSISAMERCRLAGLKGDANLMMPIVSATSNSWSAREAWIDKDEIGSREYRGPLWEGNTALAALLSGADLFMMLHPLAIETVEKISDYLFSDTKKGKPFNYESWISAKSTTPD
ncbi:MAG: CO dehydrogenase/acetyl-CoA synthase subunit delta [Candidatus Altiarchaeales archaeon]|nr:CO dehydrogenase/acetyl-CoA synthase subunit delta [Candidatus Altiarchaeales archaeon]